MIGWRTASVNIITIVNICVIRAVVVAQLVKWCKVVASDTGDTWFEC